MVCISLLMLSRFSLRNSVDSLANVRKSRRDSSLPFLPTLKEHIPFFLFIILACSWVLSPASHILNTNKALGGLIEFAVLVTFAFGKLGPRIILARLTRSPFPWFNFGAFVPLAVGAIYVNAGLLIPG